MRESSVSYGVVTRVSEAKGVSPDELRPLHDIVDPDALEDLFNGSGGPHTRNGHVSFTYEGYVVEVRDGEISLTVADQPEPS